MIEEVPVPVQTTQSPVPAPLPLRVGHVFDLSSVESAITKTLAAIPPDHNVGVVLHGEIEGPNASATVALVVKKGPLQWEIQATVASNEPVKAETNLIFSGKF